LANTGFDHSYLLEDQNRFFSPRNHRLDDKPLPAVERGEGFYGTTAIASHALRWLEGHRRDHPTQPFFLYLAFTSPHFPLHALQQDIDRYKDRYNEGWDVVRERRWRRLRSQGLVRCGLSKPDTDMVPAWNLTPADLRAQVGPGEVPNAVPWSSLSREQKEFQAAKMAIHAAMVTRMDLEAGRVLDYLRDQGQLENTVVIFLSDNGASAEMMVRADGHDRAAPPGSSATHLCLGPGWAGAANAPFRLSKHWIHEGGISSPMLVHWPAGIRDRGKLRHTPVHLVDMLPTLVDLAGGKPLETAGAPPFEGKSLAPLFQRDGTVEHDHLFFHHMYNRGIRQGDEKLVWAGENGPWELYDLKHDRCERNNLATRKPARAKALAELWERREREFAQQKLSS